MGREEEQRNGKVYYFQNRDYPANVVQRAQERVSAIPRDAITSKRSDVPDDQPTIALVNNTAFFLFFLLVLTLANKIPRCKNQNKD